MKGTSLNGSFNLKIYFKLNSYYQSFYCRQPQNNLLFLWCKNRKENWMEKMYANLDLFKKKTFFFHNCSLCVLLCRPSLSEASKVKVDRRGQLVDCAVCKWHNRTSTVSSSAAWTIWAHSHSQRWHVIRTRDCSHMTKFISGIQWALGGCHDWCGCEGATRGRLPDNLTFPWGCALQIGH